MAEVREKNINNINREKRGLQNHILINYSNFRNKLFFLDESKFNIIGSDGKNPF